MVNPYESPFSATGQRSTSRSFQWLLVLVWCYPVLLVASFYVTWLMAWLQLGHRPRPSLDDPGSISFFVDACVIIAGILLVGSPGAALAGVAVQLLDRRHSWWGRALCSTVAACLWVVTITFLRWDPLRVVDWYMD